jgi:uncharacterized protein YecA (UPF0149 family)
MGLAITKAYTGISNVLTTPVSVTNIATKQKIKTEGIWDTGATNSVITQRLAKQLGLNIISYARSNGVHGMQIVPLYFCELALDETVVFKLPVTQSDELSEDKSIGVLIGMDIINQGDFSVSNGQGKTTMSYMYPAVHQTDFVKEAKTHIPAKADKKPGRNDNCPCGSGRKYKNCCLLNS